MLFLCFVAICPNLTVDHICRILIPVKSSYTTLVIAHNHVNSGHMSTYYNGSKLRNSFLIPNDTPIIKSVLNKYQVCFDQGGQRYHVPDSLDLPGFSFDSSNPWKVTFLDMTGHYLLGINMVMQRNFISLSLCVLRQVQATLKLPCMLP